MLKSIQIEFFNKCPNMLQCCELYEQLPDLYFILKNKEGYYVYLNTALLSRLKLDSSDDLIGKNDYNVYPERLANLYRQEDLHIFQSTQKISGEIHEVEDGKGEKSWFHTIKKPVYDMNNNISGLLGVMRDCHTIGASVEKYQRMEQSLQYIKKNYAQPLTIQSLATIQKMSPSYFQRVFREVFSVSPIQMVNQTRIRAARSLLLNSTHSITEIAYMTGFYDHSHFSKKFKTDLGISPREFRGKYISPLPWN